MAGATDLVLTDLWGTGATRTNKVLRALSLRVKRTSEADANEPGSSLEWFVPQQILCPHT